jgi:TfoX N-terminal domain
LARDKVWKKIVTDQLEAEPGITERAMFGGRALLLNGNLLCDARDDGMLIRLGKGNDGWALELEGIAPMISRGRQMQSWVRVGSSALGGRRSARETDRGRTGLRSEVPSEMSCMEIPRL